MSDGVAVVTYLLAHNSPLLARVPASRIKPGKLPLGTAMPCISVTEVSGVEYKTIYAKDAKKTITERVQVMVEAATYTDQKAVLRLARSALPTSRSTINGVKVLSILADFEGPDLYWDDTKNYGQSQDFVVRFVR